jgi:hypothetical protein
MLGFSAQPTIFFVIIIFLFFPRAIMFYGDTIQDTRQIFFTSWEKYRNNEPLSALENEIAQVILAHPEYQPVLESPEEFKDRNYYPELGQVNPFLHMGLHIAVREQIATNRPFGINTVFQQLLHQYQDPHAVEHLIMEQLSEFLWLAQKNNALPDESAYINALNNLLK